MAIHHVLGAVLEGVAGESAGRLAYALADHLQDRDRKLEKALLASHERAWWVLELAMSPPSLWETAGGRRVFSGGGESRLLQRLRGLIAEHPLAQRPEQRRQMLSQLAQARTKGLLQASEPDRDPPQRRQAVALEPGFEADPPVNSVLARVAEFCQRPSPTEPSLTQWPGLAPELARLVTLPMPPADRPMIVEVCRGLFLLRLQTDPHLKAELDFLQQERLAEVQSQGFGELFHALEEHGQGLRQALDEQARQLDTRFDRVDDQLQQILQRLSHAPSSPSPSAAEIAPPDGAPDGAPSEAPPSLSLCDRVIPQPLACLRLSPPSGPASLLLSKPAINLGRNYVAGNDLGMLVFDRAGPNENLCRQISREHARLSLDERGLSVLDRGSRRGSTLDGQPLRPRTPIPLRPEADHELTLGGVLSLRLRLSTAQDDPQAMTEAWERVLPLPDQLWLDARAAPCGPIRCLSLERRDALADVERYVVVYRWAVLGRDIPLPPGSCLDALEPAQRPRILRRLGGFWLELPPGSPAVDLAGQRVEPGHLVALREGCSLSWPGLCLQALPMLQRGIPGGDSDQGPPTALALGER